MWNTWKLFIILTLILKTDQLAWSELKSVGYLDYIISDGVTPCLVNILNDTAVSMACSSMPSTEEIRSYIYMHMCRPQDIKAVKIACYRPIDLKGNILQYLKRVKEGDVNECWCGQVRFEQINGSSQFFNINIFSKITCDTIQVRLQSLLPQSFQLFGLKVSQIDFSRLRQASIIVLHNSLTTPPSLLDLVTLHSLRLLFLSSQHFVSILEDWKQESSLFQSQSKNHSYLMELLDLEIIESNIAYIPDGLFSIISVKVSLSLSNNIIQTISADTFLGLTSLRALHLNNNHISHIDKAAFKTLVNLNIIHLFRNQIQSLDTNIFLNMNGGLPFKSSGIVLYKYVATGLEKKLNVTIAMKRLQGLNQHTSSKFEEHAFNIYFISYRDYVNHLYVNNKHDIKYSATDFDYFRIRNALALNTELSTYLSITLSGNPLILSQHSCFNVHAEEIEAFVIPGMQSTCFCSIGDSDREIIKADRHKDKIVHPAYINEAKEDTHQKRDNNDTVKSTFFNEMKCKTGNISIPGFLNMICGNISTISFLQRFQEVLSTSSYIRIHLEYNNISILAPSYTWLPRYPDTNISKTVHVSYLKMTENGLSDILPGAWLNLVFDIIRLDKNNLVNITDQTFEHLDTRMLNLKYNKIQYITRLALRNIKTITTIFLSNNMIHQLNCITFPQTLNMLQISQTNLTNVHFYYECIENIDFSHNQLTFLQRISNGSNVKSNTLIFQSNLITYIDEKTFQSYSTINHLDLSNNYLDLNFTKIYFNGYFKCGLLNLANNNITSVRNMFYHVGFRRILELDLSHNYITEVRELNNHHHQVALESFSMAYNEITYISPSAFQNMVQLTYADFKGNRLHYFHFMPAISHNFIVDFTQNPLHCSCHLRWLSEKDLWYKYKTDICIDLVALRQSRVVDVPLEDFVCETPCTTHQCDCYCPDVNHSSPTTHVTCRWRGLTEVPHPLPPLIQVLDISHNYIQYVNTFQLAKYSYLQKLFLSNNAISTISLRYFNQLTNLRILMLDHNKLEYLLFNQKLKMLFLEELNLNNNNLKYIELKRTLSDILPRLQKLDISNNKLPYINSSLCHDLTNLPDLVSLKLHVNDWDCESCSALHFRLCLSRNYKFYTRLSDIWEWRCESHNSSVFLMSVVWTNYVCTTTSKDKSKTFSTKHITLIVLNVILIAVAILILPCSVFRIKYSKHFRVILQHLSVVFHMDKTIHPLLEEQYDANLVYDSDDDHVRHWVIQTLLQGLEQDCGYKIKIEERDGPVGCFKGEANYMAIRDSQRTIVVLSQYFHQNMWKQDAVDQAFLCWKNHNKRHKVIFVAYDRLLGIEKLQNELKILVYLWNYIPCLCIDRYDRRLWRTLRQKMPKHVKT